MRKIICTVIVLGLVPPAIVAYRAFDGVGALSVGPVRPTYRCEPVCDHAMPVEAAPVESFDAVHYGAPPTPVPEPGTLLVFGTAFLVLLAIARWL